MMKEFERRLKKLETNFQGDCIPVREKCQVIIGKSIIKKDGEKSEFIPKIPGDSVEARKRSLIERYGTDEGAIYIELIDYADEAEKEEA